MMPRDRALIRSTARSLVRGPRSKTTTSKQMLAEVERQRLCRGDSIRKPIRDQSRKYYGVKRHSLQAQLARPTGAPIRSTSLGRST